MNAIFEGEKIHYSDRSRWFWNNGFRRRYLSNSAKCARVVNAARRGDLETVLAHVRTLGGVTAPMSIARSIIAQAKKMPADVPDYRITRANGRIMVWAMSVIWRSRYLNYSGSRSVQVGKIEWVLMFEGPAAQ